METQNHRTQSLLENSSHLEMSLVDLVLILSEFSEDEGEIFDRVDNLVGSGRVHLTPIL